MADNHGLWLSTAMALLLVWTILIFLVRVWAKIRTKHWGLDDWVLTSAMLLALLHSTVLWTAIHFGYGHHRSNISNTAVTKIDKLLYTADIIYVAAMSLGRVSAAFFVAHIAHSGPQGKPAHTLATLALVWGVASIFSIAIRGDISRPWTLVDGLHDIYTRWLGIDISGLIVDFSLWLLSANLVWGLQMKLRKRIFVLTAFAVRLVLIPVLTFRLLYLHPSKNTDPYISTIIPNIFTVGAIQFSIMACCVTSLKPFLHAFNQPTYTYSYKSGGGTGASARSATRDSYYRLDTWRKIERSEGTGNSNDPASWRPFQPPAEGHATAYPSKAHTRGKDRMFTSAERGRSRKGTKERDSSEGESSERMIIQKVTEVTVQYEDERRNDT